MANLDSSDFDGSQRIDVAISEKGASAVIRKVEQMAANIQRISPEAAMSLRGEALRLSVHLESVVKGAAKVAAETIVNATPRDTGLARGNYTLKVNKTRPGSYPTKSTDYDGQETINNMQMEIDAADREPGEVYWISNSAHHIVSLEKGHSGQAPQGMTELARQAAESYVREQQNKKVGR